MELFYIEKNENIKTTKLKRKFKTEILHTMDLSRAQTHLTNRKKMIQTFPYVEHSGLNMVLNQAIPLTC